MAWSNPISCLKEGSPCMLGFVMYCHSFLLLAFLYIYNCVVNYTVWKTFKSRCTMCNDNKEYYYNSSAVGGGCCVVLL